MFDDDDEIEADADMDDWEAFRDEDGEPIGIADLNRLDLKEMPEDIHIWLMDDYFPETTITRDCFERVRRRVAEIEYAPRNRVCTRNIFALIACDD